MTDPIEQAIQAKGLTAPRITPANVEANIVSEHYHQPMLAGWQAWTGETNDALDTMTFCVLVLKNGFTVTGVSACASPENFDADIGRCIARENAVREIWPVMGYALKERLSGDAA
jgi:hypothetical protein